MNDLETLRPEVREAINRTDMTVEMFDTLVTVNRDDYDIVRAELMRLAGEVTELRAVCAATYQAAGCYGLPERFKDALSNAATGERIHDVDVDNLCPVDPVEWVERAERAEAELATAQNTINAQQGTMGALKRKLALAEGELAALKARIAEAPMAVVQSAPGAIKASFHGYGCFEYTAENLQSKLRGKRVRLVVEE